MADAPGPKAWNLFALLPLLARNIPGFHLHLARHYGDIVRFRAGGQCFHLITGADDLATIFHHETKGQYAKGLFSPFMEPVFGRNVFNANGEEWSRRRRVLQPFFTRSYVPHWAEVIYSITEHRLAEHWQPRAQDGAPVALCAEMGGLVEAIIARIFFGDDGRANNAARVIDAVRTLSHQIVRNIIVGHMLGGFARHLPLPGTRRQSLAARTVREFIDQHYRGAHRIDDVDDHGRALISLLQGARDSETGALSNQELQNELMGLFVAANDTTIAGLIWTFILLAKHQTVRSRVMDEIDAIAAAGEPLSHARLSRLSYTTAVIEESLRLRPPAYTYVRKVAQEDTIRGYDIPRGSAIVLSPYVTHRDPVCWPEAEKFDPDRFASPPEVVRPRYAYHPFGGGQRICLGRHLAMLEMTIILASVLRRYDIRLANDKPIRYRSAVTLRPADEILLLIKQR